MHLRSLVAVLLSLFAVLLSLFACCNRTEGASERVNLSHLDHLYKEVALSGREAALIHIYAEAPGFDPVGVEGEGLACVDDVARAVIVYMGDYASYRDLNSLEKSRRLVEFLYHLQHADGTFHNFVWPDLSINRTGKTSFRSIGFWAARAVWALGYYAVREPDPVRARCAIDAARQTLDVLERFVSLRYNRWRIHQGVRLPAWFPGDSICVAAIYLLGMTELYAVDPRTRDLGLMSRITEGIIACQTASGSDFPYGAHLPYALDSRVWHGWGNRMSQALLLPGLPGLPWVDAGRCSARLEASTFLPWIRATQIPSHMDPDPVAREVIAYGVGPIVSTLMGLARLDGDDDYARLAGLFASWFRGNNPAGAIMYDPESGRCLDGIAPEKVNRNSGAESTIEALLALQSIQDSDLALEYSRSRTLKSDSWKKPMLQSGYQARFRIGSGRFALLKYDFVEPGFELIESGHLEEMLSSGRPHVLPRDVPPCTPLPGHDP